MNDLPSKSELAFSLSKNRQIKTELPAFIVGIINITPDSFYPESRTLSEHCTDSSGNAEAAAEKAAETALRLVSEGADILDLGAESTRPGSIPVSAEDEISRLLPALKAIRKVTDCPVSIDTMKADVMQAAFEAGADILNDVSALQNDKNMANVACKAEIPVILMHNHDIMNVKDADVTALVAEQLAERVRHAMNEGIAAERLILDAGICFGKTLEQNLCIMKSSREIREQVLSLSGLESNGLLPVMMALSRKSSIGKVTGREVQDRLSGTLAANVVAVQQGATFLRVHDVAETRDMLKMLDALKKGENV